MALLTSLRHDNAAKGSMTRGATELTNAQSALFFYAVLAAAGTATATTTSKVKTVNNITYLSNGVFKSLNATDNFWTLSGTVVQASSWQKYLLLVDSTGTASIQEGVQSTVSAATVGWTNVNSYSAWGPLLSIFNSGKSIVGALTVATDATHTFTPGTTLLGAAGITATYLDGLDNSLMPLIGNETGLIIGAF